MDIGTRITTFLFTMLFLRLMTHLPMAFGFTTVDPEHDKDVVKILFGKDAFIQTNSTVIIQSGINPLEDTTGDVAFCVKREINGIQSYVGCTKTGLTDNSIKGHEVKLDGGNLSLLVNGFSTDKATYRLLNFTSQEETAYSTVTSIDCLQHPNVNQLNADSNRRTIVTCPIKDFDFSMVYNIALVREDDVIADYTRDRRGQLVADADYEDTMNDGSMLRVYKDTWDVVVQSCVLHDELSVQITLVNQSVIKYKFKVDVSDTLQIAIKPTNNYLTSGKQIELQCVINKILKNIVFTKDGDTLNENDRVDIDEENGTLIIHNPTKGDEGNYTCLATTECDTYESEEYLLKYKDTSCTSSPQEMEPTMSPSGTYGTGMSTMNVTQTNKTAGKSSSEEKDSQNSYLIPFIVFLILFVVLAGYNIYEKFPIYYQKFSECRRNNNLENESTPAERHELNGIDTNQSRSEAREDVESQTASSSFKDSIVKIY
ncbi:uncharacterized protein LOC144448277 [Glandiceps talaboti]